MSSFLYMLNGLYIIDGVDIWQTYSAVILKGSYSSLLAYPKRKDPDYDDWFEEDFIDVDYSTPYFDATDVTLKLGIYGSSKSDLLSKINSLKSFLNKSGNRNISLAGINKNVNLRYKGASNPVASMLSVGNQFYLEQDLLFSNDNPVQLLGSGTTFDSTFDYTFRGIDTELTPIPYDYIVIDDFEINNKPIVNFGLGVTDFNSSSLSFEILKTPLENTYINKNGIESFVLQPLKYKEKTLSIGMVMAHYNISDLMNNYSAFFNELSKNTPISIYNTITGYKYIGFYSNQSNLNVSISNNIKILDFNIDLTITQII